MDLTMEDKIKEGYYAICLAILKGYSVNESFHALEMPNWKKDPSKIDSRSIKLDEKQIKRRIESYLEM